MQITMLGLLQRKPLWRHKGITSKESGNSWL